MSSKTILAARISICKRPAQLGILYSLTAGEKLLPSPISMMSGCTRQTWKSYLLSSKRQATLCISQLSQVPPHSYALHQFRKRFPESRKLPWPVSVATLPGKLVEFSRNEIFFMVIQSIFLLKTISAVCISSVFSKTTEKKLGRLGLRLISVESFKTFKTSSQALMMCSRRLW